MQLYTDKKALSYDDVVLVPQYSTLGSRGDADTSVTIGPFMRSVPIISSNMDTITKAEMAIAMWRAGGIGALQRVGTRQHCLAQYREIKEAGADCIVSVGVGDDSKRLLDAYYADGARTVLVDVAHAHSSKMAEMLAWIKERYANLYVIAGNVAVADGAKFLEACGANAIKVGIGGGSICKTRVVTGHGYPNFSSIADCRAATRLPIIADGGIRNSGDMVKAFAAGANMVMIGSLLAGADETPGEIIYKGVSIPHKVYRGMASSEVLNDYRDATRTRPASEGVSTLVRTKGSTQAIIDELVGGIRSGMSYCDARTLREIHENALVAVQTVSGVREGSPHIL